MKKKQNLSALAPIPATTYLLRKKMKRLKEKKENEIASQMWTFVTEMEVKYLVILLLMVQDNVHSETTSIDVFLYVLLSGNRRSPVWYLPNAPILRKYEKCGTGSS